ncbi:hypothetical protein I4U23_003809 [Adineta vaga]|nr:hypothetical protein I4U23_003809 [Adineta vaga]
MSSHDEIRFNLIMKNNLFQDQFLKLKSIALCNIHADSIYDAIFDERMELYKRLERLILHEVSEEAEHGSSIGRLCNRLISSKMEALKFLNINFKPYRCGCENNVQSGSDDVNLELDNLSGKSQSFSNLETLIIGDIPGEDDDSYTKTRLSFHTLTEEVLPRLPKLKKLFINLIHFDQDIHFHSMGIHRPTVGKKTIVKLNLNTIKIWTKSVRNTKNMDNPNKKLLKNFFLNSKLSDGSTIEKFYINNENVLA